MSTEIILIAGGTTMFVAIIYFVERWTRKNDPSYKQNEGGGLFSFIGGDGGGSDGGGDGGSAG